MKYKVFERKSAINNNPEEETWNELRDRVCEWIDRTERIEIMWLERINDPHNPLRQGYCVWYIPF